MFAVINNELCTPDLSNAGIYGVMRKQIINLCKGAKISLKVKTISRTDLNGCTAMFVSNSLIGIWPVSTLAGRQLQIDDSTRKIMGLLAHAGVEECNR